MSLPIRVVSVFTSFIVLNFIKKSNNEKDTDAMYIAKRVRHDKISNFEDKPLPWKYPKN